VLGEAEFKTRWDQYVQSTNAALERFLAPRRDVPEAFVEVLQYSVLGGGKRVRPVMALACCAAAGGQADHALPPACALELIHAYSLVHDDLPSMDDDAERRGQPTVHIKYGEAVAILAGDGLQAEAMRIVSDRRFWEPTISAEVQLQVGREVAHAAGVAGMVGGQYIDITAREGSLTQEALAHLHRLKTGALIRAAAVCGGLIAGAAPLEVAALSRYGAAMGQLFQITDDLLDLIQARAEDVGEDRAHKEQAVNLAMSFGEEATRTQIDQLLEEAVDAISVFAPNEGFLSRFAHSIATRTH